ncbi:MAG: cupin domain-containing protein, partial [Alphaproteobacteria bacterium]
TYPGSEFAHVVKGRATLTNVATGEALELSVGDHFFVPTRADMIWDVHEDVRKAYTIHENEQVDGRFY